MASIEALQARLAISQVKARYCRMVDTKNWTGLAALLTEDFVLDVSEGTSIPVIHGRDAAMEQVQKLVGASRTVHQVHAPEIELRGDEADVIWAMQDRVLWEVPRNGLGSITGYGYYYERYVRRDGEWRIASSKLTRLHIDLYPAPPAQS